MIFNKSHPIQAKITIIWKKKYKSVKGEFENELKSNCNIYTKIKEKEAVLKFFGVEKEFYKEYDIVGKTQGTTSQSSYILKDRINDPLITQFSLFNNKEHIRKQTNHIQKLLNKTLKENDKCGWLNGSVYTIEENYSITDVNFEKSSFSRIMKENSYLLLGWFIIPLTKIISIYSTTKKDINPSNFNNLDVVTTIQNALKTIDSQEIVISIIVIVVIFLGVSYLKWRNKQNVIRF